MRLEIQIQTEIGIVFINSLTNGDVHIGITNKEGNNFVTIDDKSYSGWFVVDYRCFKALANERIFKDEIQVIDKYFTRHKITGESYQTAPSKSEAEKIIASIWESIEKESEKPEFNVKLEALVTILKNRCEIERLGRLVEKTKSRIEDEQRTLAKQDTALISASDQFQTSVNELSHLFN